MHSLMAPRFSLLFGRGVFDLEYEELVPPCVGCGCTSLPGASLGLIVWCRLVLHLIRGSFLPFLPVTHSSLPLLPSEMVLSTGSLARTDSSAGSLSHFRPCGAEPHL